MDLEFIKRVGIAAVYKSSLILRSYIGRVSEVYKKGTIELVTEADTESEKAIIETIHKVFPGHDVLAEESGLSGSNSDCRWIIDPLDGTTNFAHQLGLFSISIAFALNENVVVGIVLSPVTGELFSSIKGQGAFLNSRPIKVSNAKKVSESLLVTGFPYDRKKILGPIVTRFYNCLKASQGVRRLGSAALDLCFLSCGRFDGYWEQHLRPWDTAAGVLIAQEAGAMITDFANRPFTLNKKELLATNSMIHGEMLSLLGLKDMT